MRRRLAAISITLAISASLMGCVRYPTYYTLHLPPPVDRACCREGPRLRCRG